MAKLVHGGDIYSAKQRIKGTVLDFSANINPLGMPQSVQQAVCSSIARCVHYPDPLCRALTAALAKETGIPPEWVLFGNGAADLIFRLVYALKPKKALVLAPTFAEYELALTAAGCNVEHHLLLEENEFQLQESFFSAVAACHPDIVFLCNPNNPTGQPVGKEFLQKLLEAMNNMDRPPFLLLDECFNDFLENGEDYTMVPQLSNFPNLMVLKAFTKMYAMPGLRLGYSLCSNEEVNRAVSAAGQAWSVSIPAQAAGLQALKEKDFPQKTREYIKTQRAFLRECLEEKGFQVYGSKANYLFFKVPEECNFGQQMEQFGILVRSCANYRGLGEQFYRIAVKNKEENAAFVAALRQIRIRGGSNK